MEKSFFNRWKEIIKTYFKYDFYINIIRDSITRNHILIVDAKTPTPDRDSGSLDMFNLIKILIKLNYHIHFIPHNSHNYFGKYTKSLQELGVECIFFPDYFNIRDYLYERGDIFSHVILARCSIANTVIDHVIEIAPSAKIIFYPVDIHGIRLMREAKLMKNYSKSVKAQEVMRIELKLVEKSDLTIVLSEYESEYLKEKGCENIKILPLIREFKTINLCVPFHKRRDVIFIGNFSHTPNLDAVRWLYDEIWPALRQINKERGFDEICLKIVGSNMPDWIKKNEMNDIKPIGFIENLDEIFLKGRLSIAPLRFGAGLKGKIATSLGYGVPVVGTNIAFEGMPKEGKENISIIENSAIEISEKLISVYYDETKWTEISNNGVKYAIRYFSIDNQMPVVNNIIN